MHAVSRVRLRGDLAAVRAVVGDLSTWPQWLDVVIDSRREAGAVPPAWQARVGLRIGPVDLGKEVRLVLVEDGPDRLRFERQEDDGRDDHSTVVLDVSIGPDGDAVDVALELEVERRLPFVDLQKELDRRREGTVAALQALVDRAGQAAVDP